MFTLLASSPSKETVVSLPSTPDLANDIANELNLALGEEVLEYNELQNFRFSQVTHQPFDHDFAFGFSYPGILEDPNILITNGKLLGQVDGLGIDKLLSYEKWDLRHLSLKARAVLPVDADNYYCFTNTSIQLMNNKENSDHQYISLTFNPWISGSCATATQGSNALKGKEVNFFFLNGAFDSSRRNLRHFPDTKYSLFLDYDFHSELVVEIEANEYRNNNGSLTYFYNAIPLDSRMTPRNGKSFAQIDLVLKHRNTVYEKVEGFLPK